jgi:putative mRNA 3-end processing factor
MIFRFYGGAGEVGRSCVEADERFLFDSGLKISEEGSEYPAVNDLSHIKAVLLSHAHLDHTGSLPLFNSMGLKCGIFCNQMTRDTAKILLSDSYHIELLNKLHPEYNKENLNNVISFMQNIKYDHVQEFDSKTKFSFHDAGHIPGSASILLESSGKRVLYTGDININSTRLLEGLNYNIENVDVMICEATYGDRDHPDRKEQENELIKEIKATLDRDGGVLLPSFAVGRAQEMMMILKEHDFGVPVFIDGMAKKVTNIYLKKPEYIKSQRELIDATAKVRFVKNWKQRAEIARQQGIFITTSGMLDGGPVLDYMGYMYHNDRNSVLLTGYQVEGSNGRLLLDEGRIYIDGNRVKFKGNVKKLDFSAHAGMSDLKKLISKINPEKLIFVHGDQPAIESMRKEHENKHQVFTPKLGDSLDI